MIMLRTNEMHREQDEVHDILRAANKHPSSKVAKLIHTVQDEPSQRNIVLLLIELAEHNEYSVDFSISLQYYLNLFENMCRKQQLILNEAGLLLVNSSKIYARRVDFVEAEVERQVLSLSKENQEVKEIIDGKSGTENNNIQDSGKTEFLHKKRRKRIFAISCNDGTEIELKPKKLCTIDSVKRFAPIKSNIEINKAFSMSNMLISEDYVHPRSWLHGTIYDLDHDDEIDSKRNYKLFTCHVEHRYNTLVPDINFQLHFKVKDFLNVYGENAEKEEELYHEDRVWPAIPDTYIQQYISLENHILNQEVQDSNNCDNSEISSNNTHESINLVFEPQELADTQQNTDVSDITNCLHSTLLTQNSSIIDYTDNEVSDFPKSGVETTLTSNESSSNKISETDQSSLESLHFSDVLSSTNLNNSTITSDHSTNSFKVINIDNDLTNLQVRFKGVTIPFSDLCKVDKHILTAKVRLKDVMRKFRRKNNEVDHNITSDCPKLKAVTKQPTINLNIFKIPVKHLNKKVLFKLGKEFKLYIQMRLQKQTKYDTEARSNNTYGISTMFGEMSNSPRSNCSSRLSNPSYCSDFLGFSECSTFDFEGFHENSNENFASIHQLKDIQQNKKDNTSCTFNGSLSSVNSLSDSGIGNDSVQTTTEESINNISDYNIASPNITEKTVNELTLNSSNQIQNLSKDLNIVEDDRLGFPNGPYLESKIRRWHEYLRPILSKCRERHHFDVFDIGSEIIECIHRDNNTEKINTSNAQVEENCKTSLEVIMNNKDKSHVSRYFLSTLLLVNQSNVKLSVPSSNGELPIAWKNIKMELISTVRHKVDFADINPIDISSSILSSSSILTNMKYKNSNQRTKNKHQKEKLEKRKLNCIQDHKQENVEKVFTLISNGFVTSDNQITQNSSVNYPPLKVQRLSTTFPLSQSPSSNNISSLTHMATNKKVQKTVVLNAETTLSRQSAVSSNFLKELPTTEDLIVLRKTKEKRTLDAYLALKSLKPLVAINTTERQNDDLDSGIFSNGEMSLIC